MGVGFVKEVGFKAGMKEDDEGDRARVTTDEERVLRGR